METFELLFYLEIGLEVNLLGHEINELEQELAKMSMKPTIESTWHTPCGQLFPEECRQVELQRWLAKRHNCKIPMFMTGNHLRSTFSPLKVESWLLNQVIYLRN